jgi:hypothetical protein
MNYKLILSAATAIALLAGCGAPSGVRTDPTYDEAAASKFVALNKDAIFKLVAEFDRGPNGDMPVLVATVVNVNDMRRSAPLGRTLSEQYASNMATAGFNVKEMKLRGDVFIREETGELLLSREIKDIARSHNANMVWDSGRGVGEKAGADCEEAAERKPEAAATAPSSSRSTEIPQSVWMDCRRM